MQLGDTIENAIWLDGKETKSQRAAYEHEVEAAINDECTRNGFMHGGVAFHTKHPYDDRVPPVPEHIKGTTARLLVAEADIVAKTIESTASFVAGLSFGDLQTLRTITKAEYLKNGHVLDDHQADQVIEMLGPDTIYDMLSGGLCH